MKCKLFNGVTYYTDGDVCTDIDVAPDIKSVALMHPIVNIARNTCKKEYPNVEELIIRDNVTSILIPNKMFPNVKKVSSKSKYFSSGKYLIKKFRGDNLLNAFGQSEVSILISDCLKELPITHLMDARQKKSVTMMIQNICHLTYMHLTGLFF